MNYFFLVLSLTLILLSVLPFVKNQHWIFRVPEFIKIQLFVLQIVASIGLIIFTEKNIWFWLILLFQMVLIIYHIYLLVRFTKFGKKNNSDANGLKGIKIISANIYQFNENFEKFKDLIIEEKPDIFLTLESNTKWEMALRDLESDYPYTEKITLENTYGMHLYAKIPFDKINTHFYVADDIPSIEAHFKSEIGEPFVVFCTHPPPPSPTEEKNSKERDGDLICIAKRCKEIDKPILVIGDFNTVAWSRISELFCKTSGLIDGRIGRGIFASFHAKYWFFRAPLDLVFHSTNMFIKDLKILRYIGSDHFPVSCIFCPNSNNTSQNMEVKTLTKEEEKETENLIEDGIKEDSDNRT